MKYLATGVYQALRLAHNLGAFAVKSMTYKIQANLRVKHLTFYNLITKIQ